MMMTIGVLSGCFDIFPRRFGGECPCQALDPHSGVPTKSQVKEKSWSSFCSQFFLFFFFCAAVIPRDFQPGVCFNLRLLLFVRPFLILSVLLVFTSWVVHLTTVWNERWCHFMQLLTCCTCLKPQFWQKVEIKHFKIVIHLFYCGIKCFYSIILNCLHSISMFFPFQGGYAHLFVLSITG